jgi:hypothetical protein
MPNDSLGCAEAYVSNENCIAVTLYVVLCLQNSVAQVPSGAFPRALEQPGTVIRKGGA